MKNKKLVKRLATGFLAVCLCVPSLHTFATESSIKKKKQEAQNQLDEVNKQMKSWESQRQALAGEILSLDSDLDELIVNLELLANDLEQNQIKLNQTQADYEAAQAEEEAQYEAMKLRIQYIYESGQTDYLELLLTSDSFSDFLNRSDFSQEIYEQDRVLLTAYQEKKAEVAELKAQLELEREDLETCKEEYESEKAQIEEQLAEKQAEESDYENKLADAKAKAKKFKDEINRQNAELKRLEQQRKAAQIAAGGGTAGGKGSSPGSSSGGGVSVSGNSSLGKDIANYGLRFVGNPYVSGGNSLTNGTDCSGFVHLVFAKFGISLPRQSDAIGRFGRSVSYSEAQAGDILYYGGHVGIYLGGGRVVHASTEKTGIKISNATYKTILSVRRCY